jgi:hypothetical protein
MELTEYFQSYEHYFWEWTTDEDVPDNSGYHDNNLVIIPNEGAVAYRPYVIEVLKELQPQGWPPFGALVMMLYATQDGYTNFADPITATTDFYNTGNFDFHADRAIRFLDNLKSLGKTYTYGQNRMVLLQTLCKNIHNSVSSGNAELILNIYHKRPQKLSEAAYKINASPSALNKDMAALALLFEKFPTTQSIIDAMKGIIAEPELLDEVAEEETTTDTAQDFIQELIEEPKTFQVGSLIKRIWSGLKIPMRHLSPGDQPIGGISDMTNKGELHRMLLSEFANEDEIFMSRIANNEVLYIQREIPPEENVFERIILIDTSLKNWGTPKVLAFASALAVIKHPKAHSECCVFTLGQTSTQISLDTVADVVDNMNQVSSILEVSAALEKFLEEEHTEKDLEIFFITHQENISNGKLQKLIFQNRDRLKFLVTTSSNGELNFFKHDKGTRKHLQKIILPLHELWANPPQRKRKKDDNSSGNSKKTEVPMNYPLLFPTPGNTIAGFLYEGEFFMLSTKKQLLRTYFSDNYYNRDYYDYYKTYHGCEVLIDDISVKPRGQFALARNKQQQYILCQYQPDKHLLSKLNLNTKEYSELNLTGKQIPLNMKLIYFDRNFYLHQPLAPSVFKMNLEGTLSIETVKNEPEIGKNHIKAETETEKLTHSGIKILNNFNTVGINANGNLVVSNHELNRMDDSIHFYKNSSAIKIPAEQNKNKFFFPDGSEIITDSRGMLSFRSSNKSIPEFYMPSAEHGYLSLATYTEFGGSEYYLPETTLLKVKKMDEMYTTYLRAFIDQIMEYGT